MVFCTQLPDNNFQLQSLSIIDDLQLHQMLGVHSNTVRLQSGARRMKKMQYIEHQQKGGGHVGLLSAGQGLSCE